MLRSEVNQCYSFRAKKWVVVTVYQASKIGYIKLYLWTVGVGLTFKFFMRSLSFVSILGWGVRHECRFKLFFKFFYGSGGFLFYDVFHFCVLKQVKAYVICDWKWRIWQRSLLNYSVALNLFVSSLSYIWWVARLQSRKDNGLESSPTLKILSNCRRRLWPCHDICSLNNYPIFEGGGVPNSS